MGYLSTVGTSYRNRQIASSQDRLSSLILTISSSIPWTTPGFMTGGLILGCCGLAVGSGTVSLFLQFVWPTHCSCPRARSPSLVLFQWLSQTKRRQGEKAQLPTASLHSSPRVAAQESEAGLLSCSRAWLCAVMIHFA